MPRVIESRLIRRVEPKLVGHVTAGPQLGCGFIDWIRFIIAKRIERQLLTDLYGVGCGLDRVATSIQPKYCVEFAVNAIPLEISLPLRVHARELVTSSGVRSLLL